VEKSFSRDERERMEGVRAARVRGLRVWRSMAGDGGMWKEQGRDAGNCARFTGNS